ncbi:MAG: hypothetical protein HY043_05330 [Verrucomicrobia bacterium]|nr:hypothetical protein [Verrucomicrobiota bacterium]
MLKVWLPSAMRKPKLHASLKLQILSRTLFGLFFKFTVTSSDRDSTSAALASFKFAGLRVEADQISPGARSLACADRIGMHHFVRGGIFALRPINPKS